MTPVDLRSLPKNLQRAIYLFSEREGISTLDEPIISAIACVAIVLTAHDIFPPCLLFESRGKLTGFTKPSYAPKDSRADLWNNPIFAPAFTKAKTRVSNMDIRYVEETDPVRQALLEIYVSTVLGTRYNDFENH